jgi:cytochrome c peroxidase
MMIKSAQKTLAIAMLILLAGCNLPEQAPDISDVPAVLTELDGQLSSIIAESNLNAHPLRDLPNINDALPQLGKKLFFTKALGGQFDSACVTCHHPNLGGADGLSLPVGVDAVSINLLGPGREHTDGLPLVPRNAPTIFNAGLWDVALFHDGRVESLTVSEGTNGSLGDIRTPDTAFNVADIAAGDNLVAAQAVFPVTSAEEMRGTRFEAGSSNSDVRNHLAARLGNYDDGLNELVNNTWLSEFQAALGSNGDAQSLITFGNIANALGEYERSMVFTSHPWQLYMDGDTAAISEDQKAGAVLFFTDADAGGAGCAACHNGQLFSDEQHHVVAFPQIGPGKGDGANGDDDFGRARETSDDNDRYHFRTASLLNLKVTAPYGHSGSYNSLQEVVRHYINPNQAVDSYFDGGRRGNELCQLDQFDNINDCDFLYPNAQSNSELAVDKLRQEQNTGTSRLSNNIRLNGNEVDQLVAFLEALTDPCVESPECMADWIPTPAEAADDQQLNGVNRSGQSL